MIGSRILWSTKVLICWMSSFCEENDELTKLQDKEKCQQSQKANVSKLVCYCNSMEFIVNVFWSNEFARVDVALIATTKHTSRIIIFFLLQKQIYLALIFSTILGIYFINYSKVRLNQKLNYQSYWACIM